MVSRGRLGRLIDRGPRRAGGLGRVATPSSETGRSRRRPGGVGRLVRRFDRDRREFRYASARSPARPAVVVAVVRRRAHGGVGPQVGKAAARSRSSRSEPTIPRRGRGRRATLVRDRMGVDGRRCWARTRSSRTSLWSCHRGVRPDSWVSQGAGPARAGSPGPSSAGTSVGRGEVDQRRGRDASGWPIVGRSWRPVRTGCDASSRAARERALPRCPGSSRRARVTGDPGRVRAAATVAACGSGRTQYRELIDASD